ncbi:uncharacterized protein FA14DRAFT_184831 [Meira miltonrushii]|uniref:Uncharacterized protein n=1 Tax=Meira miltonrushii TaxID=1280837 RepID=A0A316VEP1_9BASI|nr:uncharacterized protein FA14DRAFT_184831 [Meira miltonrushii]PWN36089.1 hypothetical protein FA14DRAFT_184831 [Meira miltonrushii]
MSISTFCLAPPQTYRNNDAYFDEEDALFENTVQALSSVFFVSNNESDNAEPSCRFFDDDCSDADFTWAFPKVSIPPAKKTEKCFINQVKKRSNTLSSEDDDYDSEIVTPDKVIPQKHPRGKRSGKKQADKEVQSYTPGMIAFTGLLSSPTGSQNSMTPKKIRKSKKNVQNASLRRSPRLRKTSKNRATVKSNKKNTP